MKSLTLLFLAFFFISCSKEDLHGPLKLKNGQEVELLVDHKYAAVNEMLLRLPNKEDAGASLAGFEEREPGYTYRVKAKFHFEENPPEDSPAYWFDFVKIIKKEQYKGTEPFEIELIVSYIPGGPIIRINKEANNYYFISEKIQLTYASDVVKSQLEEIWQNAKDIRENWQLNQLPKWRSIKATVVHDQQKFGKAYFVQQIAFL